MAKRGRPVKTRIEKTAKTVKIKELKTPDFLFKLSSVIKSTYALPSPFDEEIFIGTYDFTSCFQKKYDSVSNSIVGKFVELPLSKMSITEDGKLHCEVYQNDTGSVVNPGSKIYSSWVKGETKLWLAKYDIVVKLPGKNKVTKEDLKKVFYINYKNV